MPSDNGNSLSAKEIRKNKRTAKLPEIAADVRLAATVAAHTPDQSVSDASCDYSATAPPRGPAIRVNSEPIECPEPSDCYCKLTSSDVGKLKTAFLFHDAENCYVGHKKAVNVTNLYNGVKREIESTLGCDKDSLEIDWKLFHPPVNDKIPEHVGFFPLLARRYLCSTEHDTHTDQSDLFVY